MRATVSSGTRRAAFAIIAPGRPTGPRARAPRHFAHANRASVTEGARLARAIRDVLRAGKALPETGICHVATDQIGGRQGIQRKMHLSPECFVEAREVVVITEQDPVKAADHGTSGCSVSISAATRLVPAVFGMCRKTSGREGSNCSRGSDPAGALIASRTFPKAADRANAAQFHAQEGPYWSSCGVRPSSDHQNAGRKSVGLRCRWSAGPRTAAARRIMRHWTGVGRVVCARSGAATCQPGVTRQRRPVIGSIL